MSNKTKIELGDRVQCQITGFEGVAVSVCKHLNGCVNYSVKPPVDRDGKDVENVWVDVEVLKVIKRGVVPAHSRVVGGFPPPPQRDNGG